MNIGKQYLINISDLDDSATSTYGFWDTTGPIPSSVTKYYSWNVNGTEKFAITSTGLKMTTGTLTAGYVLALADSAGNAVWTDISSTAGPWFLNTLELYPDSTTYNVSIGTTATVGGAKLTVKGAANFVETATTVDAITIAPNTASILLGATGSADNGRIVLKHKTAGATGIDINVDDAASSLTVGGTTGAGTISATNAAGVTSINLAGANYPVVTVGAAAGVHAAGTQGSFVLTGEGAATTYYNTISMYGGKTTGGDVAPSITMKSVSDTNNIILTGGVVGTSQPKIDIYAASGSGPNTTVGNAFITIGAASVSGDFNIRGSAAVASDAFAVTGSTATVVIGADAAGASVPGVLNIKDANAATGRVTIAATGTDGKITLGYDAVLAGSLKLWSSAAGHYSTTLTTSATQSSNVTYTLPVDDGTPNQVLYTDGTGVLGWVTAVTTQSYEYLLSSTAAVDVGAVADYSLYTVPALKSCVITRVVIRNASASFNQATDPVFDFGWNATASNVVNSATYTTPSATTTYIQPALIAEPTLGTAGDILKCHVGTAATASTTCTVDVFGYLF